MVVDEWTSLSGWQFDFFPSTSFIIVTIIIIGLVVFYGYLAYKKFRGEKG